VNQIQVHSKIGLTFAQGLRSVLRQDPDVIMVGEIRDLETAEIAIRAALTGHLVLSTLHTTDAAGAIVRLIDMGIEPHLLVSSLNLVLAQRLVRTTCSVCRNDSKNRCHQCHGSGLHGRSGLFEIMPVSESLHSLIMSRANASEIREQVVTLGMRTLQVEGKRLVDSGVTTLSEILRVVEEVQ
jgi:type II secretory ATPase GspE/PulE/Tfp pilus assembly ATPase PilB-like protein